MILLLLFFSIIDNNNAVRVQSASSSSSSLSLTSSPIQDQNNDLSNAITHAVTPLSDKEKALLLAKPVYECEGCPSKDANMKDGSSGAVNNGDKYIKSSILTLRKTPISGQMIDKKASAEEASKLIADTIVGLRHSSTAPGKTPPTFKKKSTIEPLINRYNKDEEGQKNTLKKQESKQRQNIEHHDYEEWQKLTQRVQIENTIISEIYPVIDSLEPLDAMLNAYVSVKTNNKGGDRKDASICKGQACLYKCTANPGNHTGQSRTMPVAIAPLRNGVTYTVKCTIKRRSRKESIKSMEKTGMPFAKPGPPVLLNVEVNWFHDAKKVIHQESSPGMKWQNYSLYVTVKPGNGIYKDPFLQRWDGGLPIIRCNAKAIDKTTSKIYHSGDFRVTRPFTSHRLIIKGTPPRHEYEVQATCSHKYLTSDWSNKLALTVPTRLPEKDYANCYVDPDVLKSGKTFRLPGFNEARYLSRVIYTSCDLRHILFPGDYVKCDGLEKIVTAPQDPRRFTTKQVWCEPDIMELECFKMGIDYKPEPNDWIPLSGKYAVLKNSTCVTAEQEMFQKKDKSKSIIRTPNEDIHNTECIKLGCRHYTVVDGGSPAKPGTVLRPCPLDMRKKTVDKYLNIRQGIDDVEDKVKSDRLVEEIEEGLEMTAEHIPFGKYKPSKMYNGKKMSLSGHKELCGRIPGYELMLERKYEGETDALVTAYRLKPFPPPVPSKPIEQPTAACEVVMDEGSKKAGLMSCPCSAGELVDIYVGTPYNDENMNNLPCNANVSLVKNIFKTYGKVLSVTMQTFGATGTGTCPKVTSGQIPKKRKKKEFNVDLKRLKCDEKAATKLGGLRIRKRCVSGTCYILDYEHGIVTNLDYNPMGEAPSTEPLPLPLLNTPEYAPMNWPAWFKCYKTSKGSKNTAECMKLNKEEVKCNQEHPVDKAECEEKNFAVKYPPIMTSLPRHLKDIIPTAEPGGKKAPKSKLEKQFGGNDPAEAAGKALNATRDFIAGMADKATNHGEIPSPETQMRPGCVKKAIVTYKVVWASAKKKPMPLSPLMEAEMVETVQLNDQTAQDFVQQFLLDNPFAASEIAALAAVCSVKQSMEDKLKEHTIYDYYGPEGWAAPKTFGKMTYKNKWGVKGGWYQNEKVEDEQKIAYFHTVSQNGGKMPDEGVFLETFESLLKDTRNTLLRGKRTEGKPLKWTKNPWYFGTDVPTKKKPVVKEQLPPPIKCESPPYAIVRMEKKTEAIRAVKALNGATASEFGGQTLDVHFASPTEKKFCDPKCDNIDAIRRNMSKLYVFAVKARAAYLDMAQKEKDMKGMESHLGYGTEASYKKIVEAASSAVRKLKKEAIRTWKIWYDIKTKNEPLAACAEPNCVKTFNALKKCDKVKIGQDMDTVYTVVKVDQTSHAIEFDPPLTSAVGDAGKVNFPIYFTAGNGDFNENLVKLAEEKMACLTMSCILNIEDEEMSARYEDGGRDLHGGHNINPKKECKLVEKENTNGESSASKQMLGYIGSKETASIRFKCLANTKFVNKVTLPKAAIFQDMSVNIGGRDTNAIVGGIYKELRSGAPGDLISLTEPAELGPNTKNLGKWTRLKFKTQNLKLDPGFYFLALTIENNAYCYGKRSYNMNYLTTYEQYNHSHLSKEFPTIKPLQPAKYKIAMFANYFVDLTTEAKLDVKRKEIEADQEREKERLDKRKKKEQEANEIEDKSSIIDGDKPRFLSNRQKLKPNEKQVPITERDESWVPKYQKDDVNDPTWYPNSYAVPPADGMPDFTKTERVRNFIKTEEQKVGDTASVQKHLKVATIKRL